MKPKRVEILGVPVDCVTMAQALDWTDTMMEEHRPCTIIAVNPEKVMRAQQDNGLLGQLRSAELLIPDGIGTIFVAGSLTFNLTRIIPSA